MEHTWNVYHQFNGVGVSKFVTQEVKISEELYQRIQEAIEKEISFADCGILAEIEKEADLQLDCEEVLALEYPDEADYDLDDEDGQEEYSEAIEQYENELESYFLEQTCVEDPTDLILFRKAVLGKYYNMESAKERSTHTETVETWDYTDTVRSWTTIYLNDDEVVVAVDDPQAEGLESETIKSSDYGDFYPDYEGLKEEITDIYETLTDEDTEETEDEEI